MLKNYILTAIRSLWRHKFFSAINIFGLSLALSIGMGIIMLVADQMSHDSHNSRKASIYRIISQPVNKQGQEIGNETATSPMTLRNELLDQYTGIEMAVRLKRGFGNHWLEFENQNVNIPLGGFFADPETLAFFEYELEYGDPVSSLIAPFSVVLTKKAARKLFGESNPLGQTVKVGDIGTYTVTGVLKETNKKSHIVFEALASMSTVESLKKEVRPGFNLDQWDDYWNGWTYIMVSPETSRSMIQTKLDKISQEHYLSIEDPEANLAKFKLQALTSITPGPMIGNAIGPTLPWIFVYFLGGMAFVILITSCFNFTNLSIARSLTRAREIGVRKVTGATRWQVITQFLSESVVVSICALGVAFLLLLIVKPFILQLSYAKAFKWDLQSGYHVIAIFILFAAITGIIAGLFPAVVLSSFKPVNVLKSLNNLRVFSKLGVRKVLLVSQFTVSLIFIISVIVMYNQFGLFMGKDHGFNMKNKIVVMLNNTPAGTLKSELLKYNNIESVSAASHLPASGTSRGNDYRRNSGDEIWISLNSFSVDEDYIDNLELQILAGQGFSSQAGENNKNLTIINEEAVKRFQFESPMDAVGEVIISRYDSMPKTIIGVVKDYHNRLLMEKIAPMTLEYNPDEFQILQVKYSGLYGNASNTITRVWTTINPALKPDLRDFEGEIKLFYDVVFRDIVNILGVITILAIFISCLGLLGMAVYTTESRIREISIRKVLGSTDKALVLLLSRGFLAILMISILIAVPVAWFVNNLWLEQIAYHVSVDIFTIFTGIFFLLLFGVITIGSQTIRAAFVNPVENLKNE